MPARGARVSLGPRPRDRARPHAAAATIEDEVPRTPPQHRLKYMNSPCRFCTFSTSPESLNQEISSPYSPWAYSSCAGRRASTAWTAPRDVPRSASPRIGSGRRSPPRRPTSWRGACGSARGRASCAACPAWPAWPPPSPLWPPWCVGQPFAQRRTQPLRSRPGASRGRGEVVVLGWSRGGSPRHGSVSCVCSVAALFVSRGPRPTSPRGLTIGRR